MKSLKQYLNEVNTENQRDVNISGTNLVFEQITYRQIPGTQNSFRQDSADTNTKTQKHTHVYAKPNGKGKELYSVNFDGTGHDGSSRQSIPKKHADFLRQNGYSVSLSNTLESLLLSDKKFTEFSIFLIEEQST
jgi:hypothetical protein